MYVPNSDPIALKRLPDAKKRLKANIITGQKERSLDYVEAISGSLYSGGGAGRLNRCHFASCEVSAYAVPIMRINGTCRVLLDGNAVFRGTETRLDTSKRVKIRHNNGH